MLSTIVFGNDKKSRQTSDDNRRPTDVLIVILLESSNHTLYTRIIITHSWTCDVVQTKRACTSVLCSKRRRIIYHVTYTTHTMARRTNEINDTIFLNARAASEWLYKRDCPKLWIMSASGFFLFFYFSFFSNSSDRVRSRIHVSRPDHNNHNHPSMYTHP